MIILKTKINVPPLRHNLLERPFLYKEMDRGSDRKLTLVSAPAGFGKTSLVCQWLHERKNKVAWFSIDEDDNEPSVFIRYLLATLQSMDDDLYNALNPLQQDVNMPGIKDVMSMIIDQLFDHDHKIYLVFDDFHLIHSGIIIDAVGFLLMNLPNQLHITIITRQDPPLPLARLRIIDDMMEIRADNLKFNEKEACHLFNRIMDMNLSTDDIRKMTEQTEGWAVGLQMAGMALKNNPDLNKSANIVSTRSRYVFDYLLEEVIKQQPQDIMFFLLRTSVLRFFNTDLCNEMMNIDNTAEILDHIRNSGLFIVSMDDNDEWFRYHHLFGEFLRHRLMYYEKESIEDLHKKACVWYEKNDYVEEAFFHAVSSKDFEFTADLLERQIFSLLSKYQLVTTRRLLNQIPVDIRQKRYILRLCLGFVYFMQEEFEDVIMILSNLEESFERLTAHYDDEKKKNIKNIHLTLQICNSFYKDMSPQTEKRSKEILDKISGYNEIPHAILEDVLTLTLIYQGKISEATERIDSAVRIFEQKKASFSSAYYMIRRVDVEMIRGRLRRAETYLSEAIDKIKSDKDIHNPAFMYLYAKMAEIYYRKNKMDQALNALIQTMDYAKAISEKGVIINAYQLEAFIHHFMGNEKKANDLMEESLLVAHNTRSVYRNNYAEVEAVRLALLQNNIDKAKETVNSWNLNDHEPYNRLYEKRSIMTARLCLMERDYEKALNMMLALKPLSITCQCHETVLEIDAIASIALNETGRENEAFKMMAQAMKTAEQEGYIWPFIEYEIYLTDMINQLLKSNNNKIRLHATELIKAYRNKIDNPILTPREADVMRLISSGFSNREIAEQTFVSMSTVKSHINKIFNKLCVSSREDAVIKAKELNIT